MGMPYRAAVPARLGGGAAVSFLHCQQADCPARLGRQLQPATAGKGQRAARLRDHQRRGPRAQGFFGCPEKIAFAACADRDDLCSPIADGKGVQVLAVP